MEGMNGLRERIEKKLRERIETAERAFPAGSGKLDVGPLFARLDEVIQVVEGIRDFSVEPYRERVREIICSSCRQDGSGNCKTRAAALCGLDKYFDTIVAVIEQELKTEPGGPA
jgi:hypothetical protein